MSPELRRRLLIALDVGAVLTIVCAGRSLLPADTHPDGAPFWARTWDVIIFGPDAGAWAANAWAIHDGRFADLDPHRLPTWPMLVGTLMKLLPDVALAGHLVNHLFQALMPLSIWGLARGTSGRATAFAAGFAAAMIPATVTAAQRFGVDPTVAFFVPFSLFLAWASARVWWLAPVGGAAAALCAVAHLTTLPFPIVGLLLVLLHGKPGWRRWASLVMWGAALYGTVRWVLTWYPALPSQFVGNVLAEGIAPEHNASAGQVADAAKETAALDVLRANAPKAVDDAIRFVVQTLRPAWLDWRLALALPWLGLVGPLDRTVPPGRAVLRGLATGVPLLACMAPIVAFHAADAPARYSENLLPVAALLLVRGAMVLPSLVDLALGRWAPVATGLAGTIVAGAWSWERFQTPRVQYALPPPRIEELLPQAVGTALREHFPTGIGAVCPYREALGYGGWLYCPNATCPSNVGEQDFRFCVEIMRKECPGTGDIPYVVFPYLRSDLTWPARTAMDRWITDSLPPVADVVGGGGHATIYAVPREDRVGE